MSEDTKPPEHAPAAEAPDQEASSWVPTWAAPQPFEIPPAADPAPPEPAILPDAPLPEPASMAMTKAELLERVQALEADLTKARLLERIEDIESGEAAKPRVSAPTLAAMPGGAPATDFGVTHTVSLNGTAYSWTDETAHTVPAEAVAIYERSRVANGG